MLARYREPALIWLFFFVVCFVAAFHRGFDAEVSYDPGSPAQNQTLAMRASAAETTAKYGGGAAGKYRGGDLASYLAAGERLLEAGDFEKDFAELWPPGMAIAAAMVLAVFGGDAYPLHMILLSVIAWSIALYVAYVNLRPFGRRVLDLPVIAAIFLLPSLRAWTFGFGAVMSESLSHAFFVMSIAITVRAIATHELRRFVVAGAMLGVATLIRAYFDYVGTMCFGAAAFFLFAWMIVRRRRTILFTCWLAAFAAFVGVTVPWRMYKVARWHHPGLVSTPAGYMFTYAWLPDAQQPFFMKGADAACKTDPALCALVERDRDALDAETRQQLALMTLAFRPLKWIAYKLSLSSWLWFGRDFAAVSKEPALLVEGVVLLLLGLAGSIATAVAWWRKRGMQRAQLLWFVGAFTFWNAVFFTLLQFEWRYSLSARVFAYFLPLMVLSLERRLRGA